MATRKKAMYLYPNAHGKSSSHPDFPWVDTGLKVSNGEHLTIVAGGLIDLYPDDLDNRMPFVGPNGCADNINDCDLIFQNTLLIQNRPGGKLLGRIGNGDPFEVGSFYDATAVGSGILWLTINDYVVTPPGNYYQDNRGFFKVNVVADAPDVPPHYGKCDVSNDNKGWLKTKNPLDARTGNKVLEVTDLTVQTPAGPLTFTREYNQNQQTNPLYQFMGLGWSHNHVYQLTLTGSSPNRSAAIALPNGGTLQLTEDPSAAGHFDALAGSTSVLDYNAGGSEYLLTAQDKSQFAFDDTTFQLKSRTWPNGEVWTYTYSSGSLIEVDDGYGRQLQFSYIASMDYDNGQLWRVGDHSASGLDTGSPSGRYIEFGYTSEKDDGTPVGSPKALLASVQDVLGNTWAYDYYGQNSGEDDPDQLNLLTKRFSPSVDTTGDGTPDGALTLEALTYTFASGDLTALNQKRGESLLETDFVFQAAGKNQTTETEVVSGSQTTHYFANGVYLASGSGGDSDDAPLDVQVINGSYRPMAQVDGRGNETELDWSANGATLQRVTDALHQSTLFAYDSSDRLLASLDAEQRKTLYLYDAALRTPSHIFVADSENLANNGDMESNSVWAAISGGSPTHNQSDEIVDSGSYAWYVAADAGEGIEGNTWDLITKHTYLVSARVYVVDGTVKMHVSGTAALDVLSSNNDVWETLQVVYQPTSTSSGVKLQFIAEGDPAEFYVDSVQIQRLGEIDVNGGMETAGSWSAVGTPTTNTLVSTPVDSGAQSRHVVTDAANEGIESAAWDMLEDYTYIASARVYPETGTTLKMQLTDGSTVFAEATSSDHEAWETLRLLYAATAAESGVRVRLIATTGSGDFYVDSLHLVEVLDLQRWQEFLYDDKGRTLAERSLDVTTAAVQQQTTRIYGTSGNGEGLLESVTQEDVLTPANNQSTSYFYDSAGRVIKTQKSSLLGSCQFTYTIFDDAGNALRSVCSTQNLMSPETADTDEDTKVTTYEYDPLGRRIKTTVNAGAAYAQSTLTVYDALDRVIRTIANYVADVGITDPYIEDRDNFDHGADNTQNLVTDTAYNARGMVRQQTDVLGNVTLYGYDEAGRLIKTVQSASVPTYNNDYSGGSPDPSLSEYEVSSAPDKDIVTTQRYDAAGNLVKTESYLSETVKNTTYTVYDALNRPVKTVRNAKDAATIDIYDNDALYVAANDPRSDSYTPDSAADRDLIDTTAYDVMGRVIQTSTSVGTSFEQTTLMFYDAQGRVARTIANYVPQGGSDPATWVWDTGQTRWEQSNGTAIDHGENNDENIISATFYDSQNRVQYTQDVLGRKTWLVYDGLGRQFRAIANYVPQGSSDPAAWVWDAGDARWEYDTNQEVALGAGFDQNQINHTEYDSDGRVQWTQDVQGRKTWFVYDERGRRTKTIVNCTYVSGSPEPEDEGYTGSSDADKDIITRTVYDEQGRVWKTFDAAGVETRFEYDESGRRIQTTVNYVNGVYNAAYPDEDLIETTTYDLAGRVLETVDARGTKTSFTYDAIGRRLTVTLTADSPLAATTYTCYDKAGWVRRTIANYTPLTDDQGNPIAPDERDESGSWLFIPPHHGDLEDRNLLTDHFYDRLGRSIKTISNYAPQASSDPADWLWDSTQWEDGANHVIDRGVKGDHNLITITTYRKDGQVDFVREVEGVATKYAYDQLRRRTTVVQNFVDNGEDPALWVWDDVSDNRWEKSGGTAIAHGADNDQNIIVRVTYDLAGRMTSLRNPNGALTAYAYDGLNRRTTLTNAISKTWTTTYELVTNGALRSARMTLTDPNTVETQRDSDLVGRLATIQYGDPSDTPDVQFTYDKRGSRTKMSEYSGAGFTSKNRETTFGYDDVQRLSSVGFDNDGGGSVDQTVSYEYDAGGRRTKLTLPSSLNVTYVYDVRGQLVSLTDWDSQVSEFNYDLAGRHVATRRANGLHSRYHYDAGGRLRLLRHTANAKTLAYFGYDVDGRGNRTAALEALPQVGPGTTTIAYNHKGIVTRGTWSDVSGTEEGLTAFKKNTTGAASLKFMFFGSGSISLKVGEGPDHSIFDIYLDGSLWQSVDGYAASGGERTISITFAPADSTGPHTLELRNRLEKRASSSGYKLRFKSLAVDGLYDLHTIEYTYDKIARLLEARYNPGLNVSAADGDLLRRYLYTYDRAGNRLSQSIALNGAAPTVTNYTYNAANQLTSGGVTYDHNGNMTSDGTNSHTWDRANRLLSMGGSSYAYDGAGNRVKQTIGANVTQYLLDLQPGLAQVLSDTTGANTNRYVHALRGIHAQKDTSGNWEYLLQDGLGSVRGTIASNLSALESRLYDPYGVPFGATGTSQTPFGFTGEMYDANQLLFLRTRYYNPSSGIFSSPDLLEIGNLYQYVDGNPINFADPLGLFKIPCGVPGKLPIIIAPPTTTYPAPGVRRIQAGHASMYMLDFNGLTPATNPGIFATTTNTEFTVNPNRALIPFIHGYSVTDAQALADYQDTAIWFDQNYSNTPDLPVLVGIDWNADVFPPSVGEQNALAAGLTVGDYLSLHQATNPNSPIAIIAHSMGNIVAMEAINSANTTTSRLFIQSYLAIQAAVPLIALDPHLNPLARFQESLDINIVRSLVLTINPGDQVLLGFGLVTTLGARAYSLTNPSNYDFIVGNVGLNSPGTTNNVSINIGGGGTPFGHHSFNPMNSLPVAQQITNMLRQSPYNLIPNPPPPLSDPGSPV